MKKLASVQLVWGGESVKKIVLGGVVLLAAGFALGFGSGFWTATVSHYPYQIVELGTGPYERGIIVDRRTGRVVSKFSVSGKQEWFMYSCNQYEVLR